MVPELLETISLGSGFQLQMDLRWRTSAEGYDQVSDFCHIYSSSRRLNEYKASLGLKCVSRSLGDNGNILYPLSYTQDNPISFSRGFSLC